MPYNPYQTYPTFPQQPYGNSFQPQYPQNQQPQENVYAFVNGVEGAKSYLVRPGQSVMLMDSDRPVAYMKQANAMGQASIRYFQLVEIDEQKARGNQAQPNPDYVLRSDFNELAKKVESLLPKEAK